MDGWPIWENCIHSPSLWNRILWFLWVLLLKVFKTSWKIELPKCIYCVMSVKRMVPGRLWRAGPNCLPFPFFLRCDDFLLFYACVLVFVNVAFVFDLLVPCFASVLTPYYIYLLRLMAIEAQPLLLKESLDFLPLLPHLLWFEVLLCIIMLRLCLYLSFPCIYRHFHKQQFLFGWLVFLWSCILA